MHKGIKSSAPFDDLSRFEFFILWPASVSWPKINVSHACHLFGQMINDSDFLLMAGLPQATATPRSSPPSEVRLLWLVCRGRATNSKGISFGIWWKSTCWRQLLTRLMMMQMEIALSGHSSHVFFPPYHAYLHKLISAWAKTTSERNETERRWTKLSQIIRTARRLGQGRREIPLVAACLMT